MQSYVESHLSPTIPHTRTRPSWIHYTNFSTLICSFIWGGHMPDSEWGTHSWINTFFFFQIWMDGQIDDREIQRLGFHTSGWLLCSSRGWWSKPGEGSRSDRWGLNLCWSLSHLPPDIQTMLLVLSISLTLGVKYIQEHNFQSTPFLEHSYKL